MNNTFNTTATITNTSSTTFSGVFSLELPQINPAAVQLSNETCLVGGVPVLVFSLSPAGLAPTARFSGIALKFSNPSRRPFTFAHLLFAGDLCADTVFFHALSDSRARPDPDVLAVTLPVLSILDCQPVVPPNPLTLASAMSSIRSRLNQLAGPGALEGFVATNAGTDTSTLTALAGGATATNNGPGALAALLAAHQNSPTNPAHLVNAAGATAVLGMPNEALALLDAADAIGGDFGTPMGFDGHAIARNNRGFALLQLGQYAQAQTQLASANALEPFLAEARLNAAVAQICQGQDAEEAFLAAWHRSPGLLTLDQILDLSQGVAPDVPPLPYPGTADRLRAYATTWGQIRAGVLAKVTAAQDMRDEAHHQLQEELIATPWPMLTVQRVADIYDFGDALGTPTFDQSPPGLSDLWNAVENGINTTFDLSTQIFEDFRAWGDDRSAAAATCLAQQTPVDECEAYLEVLAQGRAQVHEYMSPFLFQVGTYDRAFRAFADPWYRALTGLAANLSDPHAHQERQSQAEADFLLRYSGLVNQGGVIMGQLATWWELAQARDDLSFTPPATLPGLQSPNACSGLKAVTFSGTLFDVISVDIECEKVTIDIAEPGLGPFVHVTAARSGDWTAFMGVKGSLPGVSERFGFYIRGNDDSFTDAGIKMTQSIGAGPLKINSPFEMELGIAAAMKCPFGFC
ncbi:MAG TPA: hypothetical protein VKB50_13145 [Vicinamibacterales bacterium]|nr:hypothetical protein [Vicinamibacterales bacterium]